MPTSSELRRRPAAGPSTGGSAAVAPLVSPQPETGDTEQMPPASAATADSAVPLQRLLDLALDNDPEQAKLALTQLQHLQLDDEALHRLLRLLERNDEAVRHPAITILCKTPERSLQALKEVTPGLGNTAATTHGTRYVACICALGQENAELWKPARDMLVAILKAPHGDRAYNGVVLAALKRLHGMADDPLDDEADEQPTHPPDNTVVAAVRQVFEKNLCDPKIAGGYLDFMECCGFAFDPTVTAAKDLAANVWLGQYTEEKDGKTVPLPLPALKKLHEERLLRLKEEWIASQQNHRAQQISWTLTKALVILVLFFVYQVIHTVYIAPQLADPAAGQPLRRP